MLQIPLLCDRVPCTDNDFFFHFLWSSLLLLLQMTQPQCSFALGLGWGKFLDYGIARKNCRGPRRKPHIKWEGGEGAWGKGALRGLGAEVFQRDKGLGGTTL